MELGSFVLSVDFGVYDDDSFLTGGVVTCTHVQKYFPNGFPRQNQLLRLFSIDFVTLYSVSLDGSETIFCHPPKITFKI